MTSVPGQSSSCVTFCRTLGNSYGLQSTEETDENKGEYIHVGGSVIHNIG